jgi:feruloyl-CoA synthase
LSENSLEHAMLALACVYVGVPYCPVSPAYALISQDFEKLRHILQLLQPGMVFASDVQRYGRPSWQLWRPMPKSSCTKAV